MRSLFFLSLITVVFASGNALAQSTIKYDSLASLPDNFSFDVTVSNLFGTEITTGDFNGDGLPDVAYSASDESAQGNIEIKFGASDFEVNTSLTSIIFTIPISPLIEFGWELGAGDLNNDGIDDLIIGLPEYNEDRGRLYVIYGQSSWPGTTIDLSTITANEGFYIDGLTPAPVFDGNGSRLGKGYAIGDLNGDNLNDLFVTAPISRHNRDQENERGYLIFGTVIQNKLTIALDTLTTTSGVVFDAQREGAVGGTGSGATFEDINGDGKEELIFSEENTPQFGRMYIIFQNTNLPDTVKLNQLDGLGFRINGRQDTRGFGESVDFGDVNGDGILDIIASAHLFSGRETDEHHLGGVYIIFGRLNRFGGNNLLFDDINPSTVNPIDGIFIRGASQGDNTGLFLDVEDFNNDGIDDLIFTGGIDSNAGNIFYQNTLRILLGTKRQLPNILDLKNPDPLFPLIEIIPERDEFDVGFSITTGDFNNDQKPDLVFGTQTIDSLGEEVHSVQFLMDYEFNVEIPDGVIFFDGGNGTLNDPYLVTDSDHLNNVRDFMDSHFKLTEDIMLENDTNEGWVPFGYAQDDYYMTGDSTTFSGCFDGNGKTISNLKIKSRDKTTGFFAYVSGCVKNLNLDEVTIAHIPFEELPDSIKILPPQILQLEIPRFVGAIAGNVEKNGLIENVKVTNASIIEGSIATIAGLNQGTIYQGHGQGVLYDAFQAGGVAAVNFGIIQQSSFEGSFENIFGSVGGIVSSNGKGTISESYSISTTTNTDIFGGVVAQYSYGIIENNYAEFDIKGQLSVGGIIGRFGNGGGTSPIQDPLSIKNNYAFGTLETKVEWLEFYKGIIGQGFVSAEDSVALESRIVSNYWNKEVFGEEDNVIGYRVSGADRTISEMKQESTFLSWDFNSIWSIDEGTSFPYLQNNLPTDKPGESLVSTDNDTEAELPQKVSLAQNYPNPFNPSTTIKFELANSNRVSLEVFDMLGRKIYTLINNEIKSSGRHSVLFEAQGLPSGVYIYQLRLEDGEILTKRFTLIK